MYAYYPKKHFGHFLDHVFHQVGADTLNTQPQVNVRETENDFVIEVAAPGLQKSGFSVSVDDRTLAIKYEINAEEEQNDRKYTRREFKYQAFKKTFKLTDEIDAQGISAQYVDGILYVSCAKNKVVIEQKVKEIEIA